MHVAERGQQQHAFSIHDGDAVRRSRVGREDLGDRTVLDQDGRLMRRRPRHLVAVLLVDGLEQDVGEQERPAGRGLTRRRRNLP